MTVTCGESTMPADLQVLRAAYPLLAKASSVFDAVILAEASATDLAVMVTLPVKGGRCAFSFTGTLLNNQSFESHSSRISESLHYWSADFDGLFNEDSNLTVLICIPLFLTV